MGKKKLAEAVMAKYGPEKGKEILTKLAAVEKVGGEDFANAGIEKLKKAVSSGKKRVPQKASKTPSSLMTTDTIPDKIKTKQTSRVLSAPAFMKKIANSRAMKKGLHAVPLIGGIASALATGDAHAAIPFLGEADALGPQKGDEGYDIENPPSKFKRLNKQMRK